MNSLNKDTKEKLAKYLVKPLLAGAAGALGGALILGEGDYVQVFGGQYSAIYFIGATCATADILATIAHDYVFPHIPYYQKLGAAETALFSGGASAAGTYGILVLSGAIDPSNFVVPAALGFGSQIASDYVYTNYVHDLIAN